MSLMPTNGRMTAPTPVDQHVPAQYGPGHRRTHALQSERHERRHDRALKITAEKDR